jgi:hypothetical protein
VKQTQFNGKMAESLTFTRVFLERPDYIGMRGNLSKLIADGYLLKASLMRKAYNWRKAIFTERSSAPQESFHLFTGEVID